jgi:hypothetical protein
MAVNPSQLMQSEGQEVALSQSSHTLSPHVEAVPSRDESGVGLEESRCPPSERDESETMGLPGCRQPGVIGAQSAIEANATAASGDRVARLPPVEGSLCLATVRKTSSPRSF